MLRCIYNVDVIAVAYIVIARCSQCRPSHETRMFVCCVFIAICSHTYICNYVSVIILVNVNALWIAQTSFNARCTTNLTLH